MNNSGLDYLVKQALGDNSKLSLYYDFNSGSAYATGANGAFTGFIKSVYPGRSIGNHNLMLTKITSTTATGALYGVTGNFLGFGDSGNLAVSNAKITGVPNFNFNNCTFLFSTKKSLSKEGLVFGSLKKDTVTEGSNTYLFSSGINVGINARNQLFVNGIGQDGEYTVTANEIELANKNICSVSIGGDAITFARYDLGLNSIEEQSYSIPTTSIKTDVNQVGFLGGGDNVDFHRAGSNYSGFLDKFAIFSGVIDTNTCLYLSSGFAVSLDYQPAGTKSVSVVTGYLNEILYSTGYTGVQVEVTGTFAQKTGVITKSFGINLTVGASVTEGNIYKTGTSLATGFLDTYIEEEGLVLDDFQYAPTGDTAEATLGLDNTSSALINTGSQTISYSTPSTTGLIQVISSGVTGLITGRPTGVIKTPVYQSLTVTGEATYALIPETGRMFEYKYDMVYFLNERSFNFFDYVLNTGLFENKDVYRLEGERFYDEIAIQTNSPLTIQSSINSQTLLETVPEVKTLGLNVVVNNTGDFYVTGFRMNLATGLEPTDQKTVLYDISQTGNVLFSTGVSGTLQTGFLRNVASGVSGVPFIPQIFLNGQKVYSGIDYYRVGETFVWSNTFDVPGRMFSHSLPIKTKEYYGTGKTDISGDITYNRGLSKLYVNGMEQLDSSFLEISSVTPINTGFAAILPQITGSFVHHTLIF